MPLLLAAAVAAQETTITHKEKGRAKKIVAALKLRLELDPEYADTVIAVDFVRASPAQVARKIAELVGGTVQELPGGGHRILAGWKVDLLKRLDAKQVFELDWKKGDLTLGAALQYLRSVTGANFFLDPQLKTDAKFELKLDKAPVTRVLDELVQKTGCAWDLRYGVVYVASHERLDKLPKATPFTSKALQARVVSLPFRQTPMPHVVSYLTAASGIRFAIDPKAKEAAEAIEVTVQVNDLTVAHALAVTLLPVGLTAHVEAGGTVVVQKR